MSEKTDLLILGATGFTGRLITRYLSVHPQRKFFTFAVGARSPAKLQTLLKELNLHKDPLISTLQVDVTKEADVERVVKSTRVVINTVGPYWTWGTPVVEACARYGVHYVDLTGETQWIKLIIQRFDFLATKTGAVIVPSCGFDSIPSDIAAFLSNKTLKALPDSLNVSTSVSALSFKGGVSGGTLSSMMTTLEQVPRKILTEASRPYSISPVVGRSYSRISFYYTLPVPGAHPIVGAFFFMAPGNRALVQRTFGLLELEARASPNSKKAQLARYGPDFLYDEFMVTRNVLTAMSFSFMILTGFMLLAKIQPIRWLLKKFVPQPGEGPADEEMQRGYMLSTNITKSSSEPPVYVKTVIKGNGDPGYLLTAIMIAESALSLIFPPESNRNSPRDALAALPPLARRGGVLTPMTAFGDVLVQRLESSGRFEFSSSVVTEADAKKND